jgi:hypothetical protein
MSDLREADYTYWLRSQPRERVFQARSAGCCPVATFLRETLHLRGVGVFGTSWKPRPKAKAEPLPRWAADHVVQVDTDSGSPYVTAGRVLQLVSGYP